MGKELNASHVLIRLNPNTNDTLSAYNKLLEYKKEIELNGFDSVGYTTMENLFLLKI